MRSFHPSKPVGLFLVAGAATCSAVILSSSPALAGAWQHSSATYVQFQDTCRDGARFGGAQLVTGDPNPFATKAVAAQPVPAAWADKPVLAMRRDISLPFLTTPQDIPVDDPTDPGATATVDHMGYFTLKYQTPLTLGPMALNIEDGNPQSSVTSADVTDCYLFAPVDVQPGVKKNAVPIGHGRVTVAVLGTTTLTAKNLDPSTYRFGPKQAKPIASALRDVNKDKRRDLVLTFGSKAAGLTCKTSKVRLNGQTASGGKLEASGKVTPTGCKA
jgi:hypothetical protein